MYIEIRHHVYNRADENYLATIGRGNKYIKVCRCVAHLNYVCIKLCEQSPYKC